MSGVLLRLACTTAVAAQAVLAPVPATAAPAPRRTVSQLLTDLQQLYRQTEQATESYNATAEKLKRQRAEVTRLDGELARARLALRSSQADAGRLAREQYRSVTGLPAYLRVLLAPDPQHALAEGHVIGELVRERAKAVARLVSAETRSKTLARAAREALDTQLTLTDQQGRQRDDVRARLTDVERLLATLTPDQLAAVARLEQQGVSEAQRRLGTAGALPTGHPASTAGERAVSYAMRQLGKPYAWGAQGPGAYDCSGLTSEAWTRAGTPIPRTSRQQWDQLRRIPLSDLRPGDLVVYFPQATHVAMYVGGGKVVQAPRPGERVEVSPLASYPVLGAVRPDATPASPGAPDSTTSPVDAVSAPRTL